MQEHAEGRRKRTTGDGENGAHTGGSGSSSGGGSGGAMRGQGSRGNTSTRKGGGDTDKGNASSGQYLTEEPAEDAETGTRSMRSGKGKGTGNTKDLEAGDMNGKCTEAVGATAVGVGGAGKRTPATGTALSLLGPLSDSPAYVAVHSVGRGNEERDSRAGEGIREEGGRKGSEDCHRPPCGGMVPTRGIGTQKPGENVAGEKEGEGEAGGTAAPVAASEKLRYVLETFFFLLFAAVVYQGNSDGRLWSACCSPRVF